MKSPRRAIQFDYLLAVPMLLAAAACGGGDEANMMAPTGNALSEAQIERALGPETPAGEALGPADGGSPAEADGSAADTDTPGLAPADEVSEPPPPEIDPVPDEAEGDPVE